MTNRRTWFGEDTQSSDFLCPDCGTVHKSYWAAQDCCYDPTPEEQWEVTEGVSFNEKMEGVTPR